MPDPFTSKPSYPRQMRPMTAGRLSSPATGRGLSMSRSGEMVTIRVNSQQLAAAWRRQAAQVRGKARTALKEAHEEMGRRVQSQAIRNLEMRLDPRRRLVNSAPSRRNRGLRAAMRDEKTVIVNPEGNYWGVGNPAVFRVYGAIDYYREIERGGGFKGTLWGVMIDFQGRATVGPNVLNFDQRRRAAGSIQSQRLRQRAAVGAGNTNRQQAIAADAAAGRLAGLERRVLTGLGEGRRRTGQPYADWRSNMRSAAASIKLKDPGDRGWRVNITKPIVGKHFLRDAMDGFTSSNQYFQAYERAFRRAGLPFDRGAAPQGVYGAQMTRPGFEAARPTGAAAMR